MFSRFEMLHVSADFSNNGNGGSSADSRNGYELFNLKDEGNRRKSRERMRKKRSKSGQGRYDLGLAKARDFKGF